MSSEFEFDPDDPTACPYPDYTETGTPIEEVPATGEGAEGVEARIWDRLYEIEDPEMPVSVVDLGLIYGVEIEEEDGKTRATVEMTLTYSGCPAREMLTRDIKEAAASADGVDEADLELVWHPGWTVEMVTEQGKADLREFGLSI